jgi:hypothetical protein
MHYLLVDSLKFNVIGKSIRKAIKIESDTETMQILLLLLSSMLIFRIVIILEGPAQEQFMNKPINLQ